MTAQKINVEVLKELHESGKNQKQIADHFGVHKSTISRAIKRIGCEVNRVVTTKEIAPVIVEEKIDIIQQIKGINEKMQRHLDLIDKEVANKGKGKGKGDKDIFRLRDQLVKYVAEIRMQMATMLDVAKTLYNAEEAQAFQRIVLQAIEDADPGTKEKIVRNLQQARSIERAVRVGEI